MMFDEFQEFRKILCVCPKCGKIVRISDLKLKSKIETPDTWLDDYERRDLVLSRKEIEFNVEFEKLKKAAIAKARRQSEVLYNKAIKQDFRKMNLDPVDVHPILNPVDFVVFQDMNKKEEITDLVFLSRNLENPTITALRTQVQKSITENRYEWVVARIDKDGKIDFE